MKIHISFLLETPIKTQCCCMLWMIVSIMILTMRAVNKRKRKREINREKCEFVIQVKNYLLYKIFLYAPVFYLSNFKRLIRLTKKFDAHKYVFSLPMKIFKNI